MDKIFFIMQEIDKNENIWVMINYNIRRQSLTMLDKYLKIKPKDNQVNSMEVENP